MLISIITVVFNGEKYIEETINSVLNQTYGSIEYIIVDGASTDNTMLIVNQYAERIACCISESDKSMYDGINKGLARATGDYVLILNSDDYLLSATAIEEAVSKVKDKNYSAFYCNIAIREYESLSYRKSFQTSKYELMMSMHGTFVPHPSLFVSQKACAVLKEYDLSYRYASDFDYILRLLHSFDDVVYINVFTTVFRRHEMSITSSGKLDSERLDILRKFGYNNEPLWKRKVLFLYVWCRYKLANLL